MTVMHIGITCPCHEWDGARHGFEHRNSVGVASEMPAELRLPFLTGSLITRTLTQSFGPGPTVHRFRAELFAAAHAVVDFPRKSEHAWKVIALINPVIYIA
eukprot:9490671-Pyramimonas_sp.AAC.1